MVLRPLADWKVWLLIIGIVERKIKAVVERLVGCWVEK